MLCLVEKRARNLTKAWRDWAHGPPTVLKILLLSPSCYIIRTIFFLILIKMKKFWIQLALVYIVQCCASVFSLDYFYPEYLLSLLNRSYIRSSVYMSMILLFTSSILLRNTKPSPGYFIATMSIRRYYKFKRIIYLHIRALLILGDGQQRKSLYIPYKAVNERKISITLKDFIVVLEMRIIPY